MAVTVVNPPQQQQGQGMNQMLGVFEALNTRKAERREAQRGDMIQMVMGRASEMGGYHNLLVEQGGEDVLKEFLTEGMGFNDEKAASMLDVIRTGATPAELRAAEQAEFYKRGLVEQGQQVQQQVGQQQMQQQQQSAPPPFVPLEGQVGEKKQPMINMGHERTLPVDLAASEALTSFKTQLENAPDIQTQSEIRTQLMESNPTLKRIYAQSAQNDNVLMGRNGARITDGNRINEIQNNHMIRALETLGAKPNEMISMTPRQNEASSMIEPARAAAVFKRQLENEPNMKKQAEMREQMLAANPELENAVNRLMESSPPTTSNKTEMNDYVNRYFIRAMETLSSDDVSTPMQANTPFAQVQTVIQTIQENPDAYMKLIDGKPQFQYAVAASDIIRTNKNLFPDGTIPPTDEMNPNQKKFYNAIRGKLGVDRGFYMGDQNEIMQGLMAIYKSVGYETALSGSASPSPGQYQAAQRQIPTRATDAIKKVKEFRSAWDIKEASDEEILARREWINNVWENDPALAGAIDPRGLSIRSTVADNRYKDALTKFSLMQEKIMAMQLGATEESNPDILQGQAALELLTEFIKKPEMFEVAPNVGAVAETILMNLFNESFGTGVSAELKKTIFSTFRKGKLKSAVTVGQAGGGPQFTSDEEAIISQLHQQGIYQ